MMTIYKSRGEGGARLRKKRHKMTLAEIRAKLREDRPTVGTWLQLPSPDAAELTARAGYDWAAVDNFITNFYFVIWCYKHNSIPIKT